ncbi:hypothetical protein [Vineibacter terrae]|uniref:hypothetical protein n=1 Tax=Vineibacter terrae TaxID=2586908 RepID=UPI002E35E676|nr:hypothetical protein [Vineibacter terrae]HEX2889289.1 hypothetical protein [Vineibacter terrae]
MLKALMVGGALLLAAGAAQAHYVWIERDGDGPARAYFGEWAEDLREKKEMYGKYVGAPRAIAPDGKELPVTSGDTHIDIAAAPGDVRLTARFVTDKGTAILYQAKAGRTGTAGRLDLELVPTAAGSNSFVLMLKGAPLAKTEVKLFGPPKWEKTLRTDEAGRVTVQTPWPGQYVAEASHVEKASGTWDGKPYEQIRHVATITFAAAP